MLFLLGLRLLYTVRRYCSHQHAGLFDFVPDPFFDLFAIFLKEFISLVVALPIIVFDVYPCLAMISQIGEVDEYCLKELFLWCPSIEVVRAGPVSSLDWVVSRFAIHCLQTQFQPPDSY